MRLSTLIRLTSAGSLLALSLSCLPAFAQDQSSTDDVAAAARKAREQKESAPKPKKVLTNDDIPEAKTEAAAPAASDNNSAKPVGGVDAATDAKNAENDTKSEAYWRKRFSEIHDKISTAEKELDVLQRELEKGQVQYYNDPQTAMTQQHDRSDINEKTAKIDAKKKEIDALKQQESDMEDELRKAGGDSGWAR
jgi:predicted RNase H-like nuclease (RuvC/YqgF family)